MKRYLPILVAFLMGSLLTGLILWGQIQNRYDIGVHAGKIEGAMYVFTFIKDHVKGNSSQKYLDIKDARLEAIEKNGVRTFQVR